MTGFDPLGQLSGRRRVNVRTRGRSASRPPATRGDAAPRKQISSIRRLPPPALFLAALAVSSATLLAACQEGATPSLPPGTASMRDDAFLDTLEHRTFQFFWDFTNPQTGMTPDRVPHTYFASAAAVGFSLTAFGIGAERGYVPRDSAAQRVLNTLNLLWSAPQGPQPDGCSGYRGYFYHFLKISTGVRFDEQVELSSMDTALLLAGVLFCQSYFDRDTHQEQTIRSLADSICRRVEWTWLQARPPLIAMGWFPERGVHHLDWQGYNEAMMVYILALGSPTHPVGAGAWREWTASYRFEDFYGQRYVTFGPLFGHQYTHCWIDFRGIQDEYMRQRGIDYFENSRRATYAQRAYAMKNPREFRGYSENIWGLTACDGPAQVLRVINGKTVQFLTYGARGISPDYWVDDGTIAPTAAAGSIAFAPEIAIPALKAMRNRYGERIWTPYGFLDAFNPTYTTEATGPDGWVDEDYLGIDQGPILLMAENFRTGLVWKTMRKNPYIRRGLTNAGFSGGWLDHE